MDPLLEHEKCRKFGGGLKPKLQNYKIQYDFKTPNWKNKIQTQMPPHSIQFLTCTNRTQIQNPKFKTPDSGIQTPKTKIPDPESKIQSSNPNSKIKTPKSKPQNPDQKALKRVCPTRVCPTRVSARPSAQQLRPQRLKHLNPLLPFTLMCCLPNFFPVIKAAVVLHGILVHDRSPPRINTFFCFCRFISTVSKMSSWKSPKKCANFGS